MKCNSMMKEISSCVSWTNATIQVNTFQKFWSWEEWNIKKSIINIYYIKSHSCMYHIIMLYNFIHAEAFSMFATPIFRIKNNIYKICNLYIRFFFKNVFWTFSIKSRLFSTHFCKHLIKVFCKTLKSFITIRLTILYSVHCFTLWIRIFIVIHKNIKLKIKLAFSLFYVRHIIHFILLV